MMTRMMMRESDNRTSIKRTKGMVNRLFGMAFARSTREKVEK